MIKILVLIGVAIVTAPFWLPTSLGGDTSYHFVLSDSMKGTLDRGALVILRRSDSYDVGDAVAYRLDRGDLEPITILHRIVAHGPDGAFVMKGDALETTEDVEADAVTGKMVAALPALGFLPSAFQTAPMMIGGLLLAIVLLAGGEKKRGSRGSGRVKERVSLFIPTALTVLVAVPFANVALEEFLPGFNWDMVPLLMKQVPVYILLLAVLLVARLGEVLLWSPRSSAAGVLSELNYAVVIVVGVSVIPLSQLVESGHTVLSF